MALAVSSSRHGLAGGLSGPLFFVLFLTLAINNRNSALQGIPLPYKNMDNSALKEKILSLAQPLVEAQGLEIWGLDVKDPPARLVRLFVDLPLATLQRLADKDAINAGESGDESPVPQASASIEQCEEISRALGLALEVEDCFQGPWTLEVSTPGLERKFFSLEQLKPYVGDFVEIRLSETPGGIASTPPRKNWRGKLLSVDENGFEIEPASIGADGQILPENLPPCHIDWDKTLNAHRLHIFGGQPKPGKGSRSKS